MYIRSDHYDALLKLSNRELAEAARSAAANLQAPRAVALLLLLADRLESEGD